MVKIKEEREARKGTGIDEGNCLKRSEGKRSGLWGAERWKWEEGKVSAWVIKHSLRSPVDASEL